MQEGGDREKRELGERDLVCQCGDVVIVGRGKVVRCEAGTVQGGRRKAKPGKKTSALARRAIAALIYAGIKPLEIVDLLSGRHSIKVRTLFNQRRAIRKEWEAIRRARVEKERLERETKEREVAARAEAERLEVETIAAAGRAYKNFGV